MQTLRLFLIFQTIMAVFSCNSNDETLKVPEYALVIHGGAGTMDKSLMDEETAQKYHHSLNRALSIGDSVLMQGGTSLDAVEQVIRFMEDDSLFNAGKGAVFTHEGKNELDASVMTGHDMKAGAIAGVTSIKNPVSAARLVMEKSPHVFMIGAGAEAFAAENGLELVDPEYFYTASRWQALQNILSKDKEKTELSEDEKGQKKHGTVGCVALDKFGNLAAGTSTGGMTNKRYNRVGDAPVIGAGTYADNNTCAVSCTGHGEYFIRYTVARSVAALMEYKGYSLEKAADEIVMNKLKPAGGEGGLIGIDKKGNIVMPFNTSGMYRGYCKPGVKKTFIYRNE
jgi:beta-aspartyl-peptidase (threonine type)